MKKQSLKKLVNAVLSAMNFMATCIGYITIFFIAIAAFNGKLTITDVDSGEIIWPTNQVSQTTSITKEEKEEKQ